MRQMQGRRVMAGGGFAFQQRRDLQRQFLAQLDPPLVEAVDAKNDALDKDAVFVKRDDLAQRIGGKLADQQRGRGAVARKDPKTR